MNSIFKLLGAYALVLIVCPVAVSAETVRWTNATLIGSPDPPLPLRTERVFPNITFQQPVSLLDVPGELFRLVLQRRGQVVAFARVDDPTEAETVLDLQQLAQDVADEKLAAARDFILDPQFSENGFLYVVWSVLPHETPGGTRVSRFVCTQTDDVFSVDPDTRLDVFTYPSGDHIGTSLNFGPDGFLYITTGDGALPFPPDRMRTAQDITDVRGSVLRIDVSESTPETPYQIPKDNPFVHIDGACPEIFAIGIRNGFRAAFDPHTDDFWVADVGWEQCEMVHRIQRGGNHGWSLKEGPFPLNVDQKAGPGELILPAIVMHRNETQSITGGVFVPSESTALGNSAIKKNDYLFGCYMNGCVWAADVSDPTSPLIRKVAETGLKIIDFSTTTLDVTGDRPVVLVVNMPSGEIFQLAPTPEQLEVNTQFARKLSDTGLYADLQTLEPASGVVQYVAAAQMNRGKVETHRVLAIPGDGEIKPAWQSTHYSYPKGSVVALTISKTVGTAPNEQALRRFETQLLVFNGLTWDPYTYRWNEEQTDADLVAAQGDMQKYSTWDDQFQMPVERDHLFASRSRCLMCHYVDKKGIPSLTPENLNGRVSAEAIASDAIVSDWTELVSLGLALPKKPKPELLYRSATDEDASLEERSRSYLSMNCAYCHRPGGGGRTSLNLMRRQKTTDINAIDEIPSQGDFGIVDSRIISPGHPERSVLMYRIATDGPGQMPKIGCQLDSPNDVRVIWDWIADMPSETPLASPEKLLDAIASTSDALVLWRQLIDQPFEQACEHVKAVLSDNEDPIVYGLLVPWVDPNDRIERVGDQPDVDALVSQQGDVQRGRDWFVYSQASQCRQCHSLVANESLVGPSLAGLGSKRTKREMLGQMIDPSNKIEPQWQTHLIVTVDGEAITGLQVEASDSAISIRQADGKRRDVPLDEIEERQVSSQSLMPAGLLSSMTPQQVADLLAFLESLK